MVSREVEIINATGLHTRPGKEFVQEAKKYACDIRVKKGETEFSAKSLLKLLKIGVSKGDRITILCEGDQETEALDALCSYVAQLKE